MTKTKQPKPIKAWATTDSAGQFISTMYGAVFVFKTRKAAKEFASLGERIVRVEIKVLK